MLRLLPLMLLAACGTGNISSACPTLKNYAPEFQDMAYRQASLLPAGSPVVVILDDCKKLRDQVRQCQ